MSAGSPLVRPLTTSEVDAYADNGWAYLPGLVSPATAAGLLEQAKALMGHDGRSFSPRPGIDPAVAWSAHYHWAALEGLPGFSEVALSEDIGRAAQQLIRRDEPVRYYRDVVACRHPVGQGDNDEATPPHQDYPARLFDRTGYINFWIALEDVPAEKGSMRFLSGAHAEGPLGWDNKEKGQETLDLAATYPWLEERYQWSPPLDMKAGDATCHGLLTVHQAPANVTNEPRWSYIAMYIPDDTKYVGNPDVPQLRMGYPPHLDGLTDANGVAPGTTFDHPRFPVVWKGSRSG